MDTNKNKNKNKNQNTSNEPRKAEIAWRGASRVSWGVSRDSGKLRKVASRGGTVDLRGRLAAADLLVHGRTTRRNSWANRASGGRGVGGLAEDRENGGGDDGVRPADWTERETVANSG
jgi:hypothetical protein